jgi:hypothetical protein
MDFGNVGKNIINSITSSATRELKNIAGGVLNELTNKVISSIEKRFPSPLTSFLDTQVDTIVDKVDYPGTASVNASEMTRSSLNIVPRSYYTAGTSYQDGGRKLTDSERREIGGPVGLRKYDVSRLEFETLMANNDKRKELLNDYPENIQNGEGFPSKIGNSNIAKYRVAEYDYRIDTGNSQSEFPIVRSLEDKLRDARAALGIPVHGSNDIAKKMKFYMYNRFKVPDTNLIHSKSITHIFFTRPDLNIITVNNSGNPGMNYQVSANGEASIAWSRNPDIFKLLVDRKRVGDNNNFNLLLSNQVSSFQIGDGELTTVNAGQSWSGHDIVYGDRFTGTNSGTFNCTFMETSDYSISNLMKLWITYIDNVSKGVWLPSYNLTTGKGVGTNITDSHVYTKTLDYASSCYVFKCGPDGEDVLYWAKFYGIFPTNTGASALSWDSNTSTGKELPLDITFKYSFRRDLNLITLLEFNRLSHDDNRVAINSYKAGVAGSIRPYVGYPFIYMDLRGDNPTVRLKFYPNLSLSDDQMYRTNLSGRN